MCKRGNGEGSIRRHGKSWHARIMDGYKPDGKPNIRYFSGKNQAEVWAELWFEGHKECVSPATIGGTSIP